MIPSECPTIPGVRSGAYWIGREPVIMHSLRRFIGLRKRVYLSVACKSSWTLATFRTT
jgi:hypothetical protein